MSQPPPEVTSLPCSHPASASGWICYAEKTHGSTLLPHISTARSPQQVMGSLVKDFFAHQQVTGTQSEPPCGAPHQPCTAASLPHPAHSI